MVGRIYRAANVPTMFELQILGRELIERGIRPEFTWARARAVDR
jgi:hypothetical protein